MGPIGTRQNPLGPVETRLNLSKHVQACWNTFKPVETRYNPFKHVSPPSPSSPFSPFFWGGGKGRGEGGGGRGEGGGALPWPPLRILTTTTKNYQNSRTKSSNLQNLCNLPLPPKGFSQSTAAQNYINTYGGGLSTKNKIHSFIHCGILQYLYLYIFIIYPPLNKYYYYYYFSFSKKKISSLCGRCPMMI